MNHEMDLDIEDMPGLEGISIAELTAGLRAVHRSFSFHDTPAQLFPGHKYPELPTYKLPLGPAVFIDDGPAVGRAPDGLFAGRTRDRPIGTNAVERGRATVRRDRAEDSLGRGRRRRDRAHGRSAGSARSSRHGRSAARGAAHQGARGRPVHMEMQVEFRGHHHYRMAMVRDRSGRQRRALSAPEQRER